MTTLTELVDKYAMAKAAHVGMIIQGHVFTCEMEKASKAARAEVVERIAELEREKREDSELWHSSILEREQQITVLQTRVAELERENAELRKDAERLDWVICNRDMRVQGDDSRGWHVFDCSDGLTFVVREEGSFRSAIDSAMKAKETT